MSFIQVEGIFDFDGCKIGSITVYVIRVEYIFDFEHHNTCYSGRRHI